MAAPVARWSLVVRAEFDSLAGYLTDTLSDAEQAHIGLLSFNQWGFTLGALVETALAAHAIGAETTVGLWADDLPLRDPGWTTSRLVSRLLGTKGRDERAGTALIEAGLAATTIARPPISSWQPTDELPTLPEPLTRADIRRLDYQGSGMGRSILQVHPDFNTPIRDDYVWPRRYIDAAVRSYAWVYDQTLALIRQRGIATLVVYNGRFTHDRAAAAAAEAAGVRVLYYDAGGLDTGFDLTSSTTHDWAHLQERMLSLWDRWSSPEREEIGTQWFLNRQAHSEPGIELFVGGQTIGHVGELPDGDQLVVFFSSSGDEIAELDLDWSEFLHSQEQALADLAAVCRARPGTHLVVRTHPHMRLKPADDLREWYDAVAAAEAEVHFDAASPVDSYALMRKADVVFTYGSTSGVEAAFIGRPVVVMGPSAYDLLGCAQRITDARKIPGVLESPPEPSPDKALPYGLMMQRRGFNYEYATVESKDTLSVGGVPLVEANELARKISHAWREHQVKRLTAK